MKAATERLQLLHEEAQKALDSRDYIWLGVLTPELATMSERVQRAARAEARGG